MPSCSGRNILYALLALQLISTFERQIFDFLGFMWVPMLANFLHSIVVILGIFGVYQYTSIYMLTYLSWCFVWIAWNTFLICYYLEVGGLLTSDEKLLTFGTKNKLWWRYNGIGCTVNDTLTDEKHPTMPTVTGCLLDFKYVEVIHASIQLVLAISAFMFGVPLAHYLLTVVEPKYRQARRNNKKPLANGHAMYSIEYNQVNESGGNQPTHHQETDFYNLEQAGPPTSNGDVRPQMTPRRVKRRSYTRNSARSAGKALKKDLHRQSGRSVRSASGALGGSANRNNKSINPVNRLMQVR